MFVLFQVIRFINSLSSSESLCFYLKQYHENLHHEQHLQFFLCVFFFSLHTPVRHLNTSGNRFNNSRSEPPLYYDCTLFLFFFSPLSSPRVMYVCNIVHYIGYLHFRNALCFVELDEYKKTRGKHELKNRRWWVRQ